MENDNHPSMVYTIGCLLSKHSSGVWKDRIILCILRLFYVYKLINDVCKYPTKKYDETQPPFQSDLQQDSSVFKSNESGCASQWGRKTSQENQNCVHYRVSSLNILDPKASRLKMQASWSMRDWVWPGWTSAMEIMRNTESKWWESKKPWNRDLMRMCRFCWTAKGPKLELEIIKMARALNSRKDNSSR